MFIRYTLILVFFLFAVVVIIVRPGATSEPAANPKDPAREDLSRIEYPSTATIEWEPRFIRPQDNLESLFGGDWPYVARFNRIDRRHAYPGMTIKAPKDLVALRGYTPMPPLHEPSRRHGKYILISLTEQWLGAYEYGRLKFSMPAATGSNRHKSPTGVFRVDARHRNHTSSLYRTENQKEQYPMDNAIRFHVGKDNVSYWIHSRDLPGKPASHGCIGLYDEAMQHRVYDFPARPVLLDSKKLYDWAVGEAEYGEDSGAPELLRDGPIVEITGDNPRYHSRSLLSSPSKK